jgi:hypothetical protein
VENTGSLLHVPIRLFLRIGTPVILFEKSARPGFAVYKGLFSPGLKAEVFKPYRG